MMLPNSQSALSVRQPYIKKFLTLILQIEDHIKLDKFSRLMFWDNFRSAAVT